MQLKRYVNEFFFGFSQLHVSEMKQLKAELREQQQISAQLNQLAKQSVLLTRTHKEEVGQMQVQNEELENRCAQLMRKLEGK